MPKRCDDQEPVDGPLAIPWSSLLVDMDGNSSGRAGEYAQAHETTLVAPVDFLEVWLEVGAPPPHDISYQLVHELNQAVFLYHQWIVWRPNHAPECSVFFLEPHTTADMTDDINETYGTAIQTHQRPSASRT